MTIIDRKHEQPKNSIGKKEEENNAKTPTNANNAVKKQHPENSANPIKIKIDQVTD